MEFDTAAELAALQAQTRRIRQVRYRPSRLDRYTGELLSLYQAGASAARLIVILERQLFLRNIV